MAGMPSESRPEPSESRPEKLTFHERAQVGGRARHAKATPEEISQLGRLGAAKAHSADNLAVRILRQWREGKVSDEQLDRIAATLSHIDGLAARMTRGGR